MRRGPKPTKSKEAKSDAARVRDLEKRLAESLEQQAATSEILGVIRRSPMDAQPVFDVIIRNAVRLCDGLFGCLFRFDGERLHLVAHHNFTAEALSLYERTYPVQAARDQLLGPIVLERRVMNVADVLQGVRNPLGQNLFGFRSGLGVPMQRDGTVIGAIAVSRTTVGLFPDTQVELLKTFADQAVIAIENVRRFTELEEKNCALTTAHVQVSEALDQQTATSEILRVISQSPTDVQPVFATIVRNAVQLCRVSTSWIWLMEGDWLRVVAPYNVPPDFPQGMTVSEAPNAARVIRDGITLNIGDTQDADDLRMTPMARRLSQALGTRALLTVPLRRGDEAIGALTVQRNTPGTFPATQVELLKTFADQAVIAIENVRLFKELQEKNRALGESLEQQTASSEILRVISRSPTDIQPVLDAVAESAARLCESFDADIWRRDGERLVLVAHHGQIPAGPIGEFILSLDRGTAGGRSVVDRRTVQVADAQAEAEEFPESSENAWRLGFRTLLSVPLMREGVALGAIILRRIEVQLFTERQIALLETFADQAVIAIENVRLFKELEARNSELRTALEQQTATSELLKVIGRSTFDLQPVFETLAENSVRLCEAERAFIFRFDGRLLRVVAAHNASPERIAFVENNPVAPGRGSATGRAALERRTIHIDDAQADPEYSYGADIESIRTVLAIPMLRAAELLGVIIIYRQEVLPFTESEIALMETFADQAAIAIENARLLNELQARTSELTRSVGELQALGEVGQAISSTLDLQTVLSTIVTRATQLSGTDAGVIYEYDEQREVFVPRATALLEAEIVETMLAAPVRKGEGATGRLAEVQAPIQMSDILEAPTESRVRDVLVRAGYRALLAVPLVREDHLLGGLTVFRKTPGEFAPEVVELLKTFATQSALAIQNARLFQEIADTSRQLELASQHKSEFLANMSHELRTPLNAIIGFSEVLSERMFGELNEKQEEYLKDIYASGTHLLSLINDILDLSKIEAGRMELELTDFHLPTALDNALSLVRERAGRRGIALQMNVDSRLGQIQADERKVRQVVLNLLSNAIKFTPEGGRIEVQATPKDGLVEISVSDTGVGIAPEDQEAVFEEFRQVGTADKKVEGTGLGLTLCRKFIELHGGRIWVKSQLGQGATFTFTIPVRRGGE
jgi:GAF domain-containing protein